MQAAYHEDEANRCPGCGRDQWLVGRITAECAFCSTALILATKPGRSPTTPQSPVTARVRMDRGFAPVQSGLGRGHGIAPGSLPTQNPEEPK